ncbi:MAG: hypothetical protein J6I73_09355 [Treponema sp.]|nr:hypothetical protein [Treponema sp.]
MMAVDNSSKMILKEYGIFSSFIIGAIMLLIVAVSFSKNIQHEKLRHEIIRLLEEERSETWDIGEYVSIASPHEMGAACFFARKNNSASGYVLVMRIETLYGPFPAVFTYMENELVEFVGIIGLHGRVLTIMKNGTHNAQIRHWIKRIPTMLARAGDTR